MRQGISHPQGAANSFNPRTPCGVRPFLCKYIDFVILRFNPRTPCGVRLRTGAYGDTTPEVSIHALLAECDILLMQGLMDSGSFNPRTPCGVRLIAAVKSDFEAVVSIHALLAECDKVS